jgi:hypothetical protein
VGAVFRSLFFLSTAHPTLRKHQWSTQFSLILSLSLLTVNYFVKPACTDVTARTSGPTKGTEQMFLTTLEKEPPSGPTLVPARHSFGFLGTTVNRKQRVPTKHIYTMRAYNSHVNNDGILYFTIQCSIQQNAPR